MPGKSFARSDEVRRALRAIASDPAYGTGVLSDPQTLANLLHDMLPDSPREAGVLAAAAAQDLAGRLQDQMSQGLDMTSAIRLAAASFESSTAFTQEACTWAAGEMAVAAGLADPSQIPESAPPTTDPLPERPAPERPSPEQPLSQARTRPPVSSWYQPPSTQPQEYLTDPGGGRPAPGGPGRYGLLILAVVAVIALAVVAVVFLARRPLPPPRRAASPAVSASHAPSARSRAASRRHFSSPSSAPRGSGPSRTPAASSRPPSPTSSPTSARPSSAPASEPPAPAAPAPEAVVRAYFAAINAHDWPRVWQLGGKNLNSSYDQMISGYRLTARDVLTSVAVSGNTVTARLLAYETTGPVQTYLVSYIVSGGTIVAGHGTLVGTSG